MVTFCLTEREQAVESRFVKMKRLRKSRRKNSLIGMDGEFRLGGRPAFGLLLDRPQRAVLPGFLLAAVL